MKTNKLSKVKGKLVMAAITQILVIILLTACTGDTSCTIPCTIVDTTTLLTICRATGDSANPYEEITISNAISPVPVNGCPTSPVSINDGKIAICHATGSETNPYNKITVSVNGLNGHGAHEGDVFPAADGNCPASSSMISSGAISTTVCHATGELVNPYQEITVKSTELNEYCGQNPNDINPVPANSCPTIPVVISDGKITICHATSSATNPYNEIAVSVNGLNGHGNHEGDIIPAPEGGCPTSPVVISDGKITICHATSSATNPYNEITVSINGLNGHGNHEGDIIPAPEGGCPTGPETISDGKITICHATGSETNPYNEITVSANGLNGHDKHEDDIIPAPAGGCPTSP